MPGLVALVAVSAGIAAGWDAYAIVTGRETVCSAARRVLANRDVRAVAIGTAIAVALHLSDEPERGTS